MKTAKSVYNPSALASALDAARDEARAAWPNACVSVASYGVTNHGALGWCLRVESDTTSVTLMRVRYVGPVCNDPLRAVEAARADDVYRDARAFAQNLADIERAPYTVALDVSVARKIRLMMASLVATADCDDGRTVQVLQGIAGASLMLNVKNRDGETTLSFLVKTEALMHAALAADDALPRTSAPTTPTGAAS